VTLPADEIERQLDQLVRSPEAYRMNPERVPDDLPWLWPQFVMALGLIPVSFLLWIFGMGAVGDPDPTLLTMIRTACLYAGPIIGTAGGLWLLGLLVLRLFWTQQGTEKATP
jgi:hypothetical protein